VKRIGFCSTGFSLWVLLAVEAKLHTLEPELHIIEYFDFWFIGI
jgi:hypothetical protein